MADSARLEAGYSPLGVVLRDTSLYRALAFVRGQAASINRTVTRRLAGLTAALALLLGAATLYPPAGSSYTIAIFPSHPKAQNLTESIFRHLTLPSTSEPFTLGERAFVIDAKAVPMWSKTGRLIDPSSATTFNPAILRLPKGSAWEYVAAMRLEHYDSDDWINILAIGLNTTAEGHFYPASDGYALDITNPYPNAEEVHDPRLFYTDRGTPALTVIHMERPIGGQMGSRIFMVDDLRQIFPELDKAMNTGGTVPSRNPTLPAGWRQERMLVRQEGMQFWEKNWHTFYPGPLPDRTSTAPHTVYRAAPFISMIPVNEGLRSINYTDIPFDYRYAECLSRVYTRSAAPFDSDIRGSAGLSRLSLCDRATCMPTSDNTIGLAILHVRHDRHYQHFVATYNLTSPFLPISAGQPFKLANIDNGKMLFVVSIAPVLDGKAERSNLVLPDHLFLDDTVTIGLGREDQESVTINTSVIDMLAGHTLCRDVIG